MAKFDEWCATTNEVVNGHDLSSLAPLPGKLDLAKGALAKVVPAHYTSDARVARILNRLGKAKAATYVELKLPTSKSIRSGDLAEILGTTYVLERTDYTAMINRLRWKDHRNMAMRGDDIIAIRWSRKGQRLEFLKGESKSRASLTSAVINDAVAALKKDSSRPSPHALAFMADQLHATKQTDLGDALDDALLKDGIVLAQVEHLLFVFSGNDPVPFLKTTLETYGGRVRQRAVGLHVSTHQSFIKDVFEAVIASGGNS